MSNQPLQVTDTCYIEGEIICVTRVETKNNQPYYYGKYCTGPYAKDDLEYAFYPRQIQNPDDIHTDYRCAFAEAIHGDHVAHATNSDLGRTVAIRPYKGKFNISLSAPQNGIREDVDGLTEKKARHLVLMFLTGELLYAKGDSYVEFINQADRDVYTLPETATPTRVRIEYELPNSGVVGAWRKQVTVGDWMFLQEN